MHISRLLNFSSRNEKNDQFLVEKNLEIEKNMIKLFPYRKYRKTNILTCKKTGMFASTIRRACCIKLCQSMMQSERHTLFALVHFGKRNFFRFKINQGFELCMSCKGFINDSRIFLRILFQQQYSYLPYRWVVYFSTFLDRIISRERCFSSADAAAIIEIINFLFELQRGMQLQMSLSSQQRRFCLKATERCAVG